ncbi:MAG: hypothetical protein Q3959_05895 [Limosilactobacillus sp.]|uniref:hypothetical protein n=1 Tax=Limosilactobacillus sp. TaxID=2773925 RepID=UPI00270043D5|nr:hypothetical protein [Limosilactobacillus sp.]
MEIIFTCLIAIIVVGILYTVVHRTMMKRATTMMRSHAQAVTDDAVNACLYEMLSWDKTLDSELVADVWGKGVLAFEYQFAVEDRPNLTRENLESALDRYAKDHKLDTANGSPATFVITDWWQYEKIQHIDVAYLLNEATKEYIDDLRCLDKAK